MGLPSQSSMDPFIPSSQPTPAAMNDEVSIEGSQQARNDLCHKGATPKPSSLAQHFTTIHKHYLPPPIYSSRHATYSIEGPFGLQTNYLDSGECRTVITQYLVHYEPWMASLVAIEGEQSAGLLDINGLWHLCCGSTNHTPSLP